MKFKKILLLFIITLFICSISSVNATTKEYDFICPDGDHNVTFKESITKTYDTIVKKDNWYYKQYLIENTTESIDYSDNNDTTCYYGYYDTNYYYEYDKLKSTDVVKKQNEFVKFVNSKGKVYQQYKKTVTYANTKTKVTTTKKLFGYYKTFKMPYTARGKMKTGYFRGEKFKYGNWGFDYGVDTGRYSYIYKVTAGKIKVDTNDYTGSYSFYKKPSYFTLYVYKK